MKRILLAIITEADTCSASFCVALAQTAKIGLSAGIEFFPVVFPSNGNWSMAFNQGVTLAWQEKLDGFLCVSPRVSWVPESLLDLVNTNKDAVAMPVATRNGFEIQLGEVARLQEDGATGEIKVQGASLDLIYLSPYALDQLCTTHPMVSYRHQDIKLILQSGDIYNSYFDPSDILAYRLRELGIELWLSANHTASRQDAIDYTANFSEVLINLKANG
jgi:hypothetical protein